MNRKLFLAVILSLGLLLGFSAVSFAAPQDNPEWEFHLNPWFPSLEGEISPVANSISLTDDLHLNKYNPIGLGIRWNFKPKQHLRLDYLSLENRSTTTLTKALPTRAEALALAELPMPA